jgi:hypothetical protein
LIDVAFHKFIGLGKRLRKKRRTAIGLDKLKKEVFALVENKSITNLSDLAFTFGEKTIGVAGDNGRERTEDLSGGHREKWAEEERKGSGGLEIGERLLKCSERVEFTSEKKSGKG